VARRKPKGKAKELKNLDYYQVYKPAPKKDTKGKKYITTRWEEVPKYKDGQWIVRPRFVAREFKWKDPYELFGVTSSANTGRMLDGLLAKGSGAVIGNVTCAFFHAEEDEEVYVDPPVEWKDERGHQWAWKLERQLYGRRPGPAPRKFGDKVSKIMCQDLGMNRCKEVPHLYFHPVKEVAIELHVDDFYAVGPGNAPWELITELKKYLTISLEGPFRVGDSFVHLKRKRVITPQGVWITPGDTRLKKLLELTGLNIESASRDIRHRPKICQLWLTHPS